MNAKSASTSLRHDPSDWANKRKVAMERAKQLRESRFFQDDSKHTLKPETKQSQPTISSKNKDLDSLDEAVLAVGGSAADLSSNYDDRSLQSIASELSIENTKLKGRPPAHSGAAVSNNQRNNSIPINKNDDPRYRSKFMQQYDQERSDRQIDVNTNRNGNILTQNGKSVLATENDINGYPSHQIKPSKKSVTNTPSWNSDTTVQSVNDDEGDQNSTEYNIAPPPRGRNNRRNSDINNNNRETGDNYENRQYDRNVTQNGNYDLYPQPHHRNSDISIDSEGSSVMRSRQEGSVGLTGNNSRFNVRALQSPVDKGRLSLLKSKVQRGRALRSRSAVVARKEHDGADNLNLNIPPGAGVRGGGVMQHSPLPHSAPAPPASLDDPLYSTKQPTNGNGTSGIPSRRKSAALNAKQTGFTSHQNHTISPYDDDDNGQEEEEEVPQKIYKDVRQNQRNIPAALLPVPSSKPPSSNYSNASPTPYQPKGYPDHDDEEEGDEGGGGDDGENYEEQDMNECPDCGRKFNNTAYSKHIKICKNVFMKKRKAFDIAQKRIEANPELVQLLKQKARTGGKKGGGGPAQAAAKLSAEDVPISGGGQKAKWKAQSEAFRQALRAARQVIIAQESGKPLPPMAPSAPDPSLIQCPHCSRRFNEKAAERHIPQCQNIKARPSALKRGAGGGGGVIGGGSTGIGMTTTSTTITSNHRATNSIKENNPSNIPNKGSKLKRPR